MTEGKEGLAVRRLTVGEGQGWTFGMCLLAGSSFG